MLTTDINSASIVHSFLAADSRSPEVPEEHDAYGWLVGSWELDVHVYWGEDVSAKSLKAEAHFAARAALRCEEPFAGVAADLRGRKAEHLRHFPDREGHPRLF